MGRGLHLQTATYGEEGSCPAEEKDGKPGFFPLGLHCPGMYS